MADRDCSTCKYGDNSSNPEGCPETCLEPELPDYDPIPPNHSHNEQLERQVEELKRENENLRSLLSTIEQRLRFALHAFPPRPPFRHSSEPKEPKDALPSVDAINDNPPNNER